VTPNWELQYSTRCEERTHWAWCCIQGSCAVLVWPQLCSIHVIWKCSLSCDEICNHCVLYLRFKIDVVCFWCERRSCWISSLDMLNLWMQSEVPSPHINVRVKDSLLVYLKKVTQDVFISDNTNCKYKLRSPRDVLVSSIWYILHCVSHLSMHVKCAVVHFNSIERWWASGK